MSLQARDDSSSLGDAFRSVPVRTHGPWWKRALAFLGPGYLVAVGYMDPGNWATSLAGGSRFGYTLLSVALLSNIMAIVLQSLCARLAIATGRDLAQMCREAYARPLALFLWVMAEIAIIATDIAEIVGTAIGLHLVFGLPIMWGVLLTSLEVFAVLYLQKLGFRWLEAFIIALLGVISGCFLLQILYADPQWGDVLRGFVPDVEIVRNPDMLYLALGILGATVMPHNLYLHSGIVQTRDFGEGAADKRAALTFATLDSTVALMLALLVNAAILILAAASFHAAGYHEVTDIAEAHKLLAPLLGVAAAPLLFGIALLCCGINSTVTATLAGQIVMDGFLRIRLSPWLRRFITRALAVLPAVAVALFYGQDGTARLLVLTQVVLSIQLPFAVVPLVLFTASKRRMGALVSPYWLTGLAGLIAAVIILLNTKLIVDFLSGTI